MGNKKILSHDADTGITKYFQDNLDGTYTIETDQDMSGILEANKNEYKETDKHTKYGEWSKVASIPLSIYYDLKAKGILDDPAAMKKWLNDPDNKYFRTRVGKV